MEARHLPDSSLSRFLLLYLCPFMYGAATRVPFVFASLHCVLVLGTSLPVLAGVLGTYQVGKCWQAVAGAGWTAEEEEEEVSSSSLLLAADVSYIPPRCHHHAPLHATYTSTHWCLIIITGVPHTRQLPGGCSRPPDRTANGSSSWLGRLHQHGLPHSPVSSSGGASSNCSLPGTRWALRDDHSAAVLCQTYVCCGPCATAQQPAATGECGVVCVELCS